MFKRKQILFFLLLILSAAFVLADNDIDQKIKDANEKLEQAEDELDRISQEKDVLKVKTSEILQKLDAVQAEIRGIETEIYELGEQIKILEKAIAEKAKELAMAKQDVARQNERMKKRLRTLYKAGDLTYLEVMVNSASFSDMMMQMDKIQILLDYDQEMLSDLVETRNFIEKTKLELEAKNVELASKKQDKEDKHAELENKQSDLEAVHAEYENNYEALVELESAIESEANELTATLKALEVKRAYVAGGVMGWPLSGNYRYISSDFGPRYHPVLHRQSFHSGIDIPAPNGSDIYAANAGVVIFAGFKGSYGRACIIDHGGGVVTLYAHTSGLFVSTGQTVQKGQIIGMVGSTGRSTGNHLHFEVRENGSYTDPKRYLFGN